MKNWVEVVGAAIVFAGLMLFRTSRKKRAAGILPSTTLRDVGFCVAMGLLIALLVTLGLRALRWPIVALLAVAFGAAILIGTRVKR